MSLSIQRRRRWMVRIVTAVLVFGFAAPIISLFVSPQVDAAALMLASGVSETGQSTTSTSFTASDTSIASGSLPAGTYLVAWGAAIANSGANNVSSARLVRGATEISLGGSEASAASAANDGRSVSGYWLGSLSGSEALTIEYKGTAGTTYIDSKFIKAIRLDNNLVADSDYFSSGSQESASDESTDVATGSWTTIKSLTKTFHASTSQDYIVLGSMEISPDSTGNDCMAQIVVDGTAVSAQTQEGEDTTDIYNYVVADVRTIGSGSKTITLQGQSVGSATCDYGRSRIYVFRASLFDQVLENESLTESTLASATWTDKTSQAYTPNQSEDVLVMSSHMIGSSAGASPVATRINNTTDAAVYADTMSHVVNNATADYYTGMSAASLTMSSGKTFKGQYQRVAGTGTVKIKEARLITWSMTLKPARVEQGAYRWFENVDSLGTGAAWWNESWGARRKITFDASTIGENLTDFPVRVSLTSSNIDYAKTQNSGQDIRFTDSDGTLLKHEIETWNESGTSEVWVKVPQIDTGSTTDHIYVYYDNSGASDGQDIANVWDSNFKTVLHLDESPSNDTAGHDDSTANAHDGTPKNFAGSAGSTTDATGKISGADHFNPDNDYVQIGDHDDYTLSSSGTYTWSSWVNPDSFPEWSTVWSQTLGGDSYFYYYVQSVSDGNLPGDEVTNGISVWFGGSTPGTFIVADSTNNALSTGSSQLITITYDGSQAAASRFKIYVNGTDVTSPGTTVSGTISGFDPNNVWVGGNQVWGEYFDGVIDESRYQTTVRSADWIKADYLSTNNALNTFSSEETGVASLEPLALQNTAITVAAETPVRLRQFLEQTQSKTPLGTAFKLQYAERSGTCDTGFSGETYSDIPTSGSAVSFHDNSTVSDGATTSLVAADPTPAGSGVAQSYEESNTFSNGVDIENGSAGLWDFALTTSTAAAGKTYCVRTVYSAGTTLYAYDYVAELSISGEAGPPTPTTEQQLRHGQGVIDGVEAPLAL